VVLAAGRAHNGHSDSKATDTLLAFAFHILRWQVSLFIPSSIDLDGHQKLSDEFSLAMKYSIKTSFSASNA